MKKSELRKIIRESIKGLVNEQPSPDGAQIAMCICDCPPPPTGPAGGCSSNYTCPNSSQMSNAYLTIGGQTPQVGDKFYSDCMPQVNQHVCTWEVTAVGNLGTSQGNRQPSTECGSQVNEDRGCMDTNALNYNECCDTTDPNCIPNIDTKECCRYEGGTEDKGCMDPNATNYNVCCNGDPNCTVIGPNPECCKYEHEPDPCKTNPKECWFCKSAGNPCVQFSQTSASFTATYTGIKYATQADCMTNSDCGERGGELEHCQCCNGGYAQSMSQQVPIGTCSSLNGGVNNLTNCQSSQSQPINCKKPGPIDGFPVGLSESLIRMQKLANIIKK
tara:strand:+ start:129 stop:1121 length:993 start_codon:yes stop_codon:yes gene_type:complete